MKHLLQTVVLLGGLVAMDAAAIKPADINPAFAKENLTPVAVRQGAKFTTNRSAKQMRAEAQGVWESIGNGSCRDNFTTLLEESVWDVPCYKWSEDFSYFFETPYNYQNIITWTESPFGDGYDNALFVQVDDTHYALDTFDLGFTFYDDEIGNFRMLVMSKNVFEYRYSINRDSYDALPTNPEWCAELIDGVFHFCEHAVVIMYVTEEGKIADAYSLAPMDMFALPGYELEGNKIEAADYYLRGVMNDWEATADYKFENEDGIYMLYLDELKAGEEFKISDAEWTNSNTYSTYELQMESDEIYDITLAVGEDSNMAVKYDLKDVNIAFSPLDGLICIEGTIVGGGEVEEPTDAKVLYLRGNVSSSNWDATEDCKFTYSNGVYTLTLPQLFGQFKISDENWDNEWTFTSDKTDMEVGVTYSVDNYGGNMGMAYDVNNATITFDPEAMTFMVEGTPVTDSVISYGIKGDFTDWDDEDMTDNGDGTYSYAITNPAVLEGGMIIFEMSNGNPNGQYWKAESSDEEPLTESHSTVILVNDDTGYNVPYSLQEGHNYTFVFDPASGELTLNNTTAVEGIVAEGAEAAYFTLQGVRVENPAEGVYIRVAGGKAVKVVK